MENKTIIQEASTRMTNLDTLNYESLVKIADEIDTVDKAKEYAEIVRNEIIEFFINVNKNKNFKEYFQIVSIHSPKVAGGYYLKVKDKFSRKIYDFKFNYWNIAGTKEYFKIIKDDYKKNEKKYKRVSDIVDLIKRTTKEVWKPILTKYRKKAAINKNIKQAIKNRADSFVNFLIENGLEIKKIKSYIREYEINKKPYNKDNHEVFTKIFVQKFLIFLKNINKNNKDFTFVVKEKNKKKEYEIKYKDFSKIKDIFVSKEADATTKIKDFFRSFLSKFRQEKIEYIASNRKKVKTVSSIKKKTGENIAPNIRIRAVKNRVDEFFNILKNNNLKLVKLKIKNKTEYILYNRNLIEIFSNNKYKNKNIVFVVEDQLNKEEYEIKYENFSKIKDIFVSKEADAAAKIKVFFKSFLSKFRKEKNEYIISVNRKNKKIKSIDSATKKSINKEKNKSTKEKQKKNKSESDVTGFNIKSIKFTYRNA